MNWTKLKSLRAGRLGRSALMLGVAGATVGGMLLAAGPAQAAVGKNPGAVTLSPTSGATTLTPTWATSIACATGFQGSAVFRAVKPDGTTVSISTAVNGTASPFSGTLQGSVAQIQSLSGAANGTTQEWVVVCFSGQALTGTSDNEMSTFVTYDATGANFTSSGTAPVVTGTTTTLTASPNPATAGQTVTLTATEIAADNTHPAGSVQFQAGGTAIGTPVAVSATGVATTTTTFAAASTQALSAVFTPTDTVHYAASTGNFSLTVVPAGALTGSEPLAVTVGATGTFTLTVATGTVTLAVSGANATGALNPITVGDSRNTTPGWSVTGQAANFTGPGTATISGNQLGWVPTSTSLATGATLGATVTPAAPGLGTTAATLASAHAGNGFGTSALGANLTLAIPPAAPPGAYTSSLTVTAVTSLP
jgi:hypothetical protein